MSCSTGRWLTVKRSLRVIVFSSLSSCLHFFLSRFHTFLLHTKMTKMKKPVKMLIMSVGTQIQLLVASPATKEIISIIHEMPITANTLEITRNLTQIQIKWILHIRFSFIINSLTEIKQRLFKIIYNIEEFHFNLFCWFVFITFIFFIPL